MKLILLYLPLLIILAMIAFTCATAWCSHKTDAALHGVEPFEPRVMFSVFAPFAGDTPHSLVMLPGAIEVGSKGSAPGQKSKQPPTLPPPQPKAPTIIDLADPSDIGQKYYFDSNYSLWGDSGVPLVSDGAQIAMDNCWWVSAMKSQALANPQKLMESAAVDSRGGFDVKLYGQWYHISDGFPWFETAPTADHAIYMGVFEKGFAALEGDYTPTFGPGWMSTEIYAIGGGVDGSGWQAVNITMPTSDAGFMKTIDVAAANHEGITIGTGSQTTTLVASHAYEVTGYSIVDGVTRYRLRNPWEIDGDDADVTLGQFRADVVGIVGAY